MHDDLSLVGSRIRREMKPRMAAFRPLGFLLAVPIVACSTYAAAPDPSDVAALLALHDAALKAHIEDDLDLLLSTQADNFILVNSGAVSTPTRQERRAFLGPYLQSTKFHAYRDRVTPVINVSRDGTLGWVVTQVEAMGTAVTRNGRRQPVEFVVAWVELYERRDGKWVSVGNASSIKPDS